MEFDSHAQPPTTDIDYIPLPSWTDVDWPDFAIPAQSRKRKRSLGTANEPIELSDSEDTLDFACKNTERLEPVPFDTPAPDQWDVTACLGRVLELFPDISRNYVLALWELRGLDFEHGIERCQGVIETIAEATKYPKEKDLKAKNKEAEHKPQHRPSAERFEAFRGTKEYQKLSANLLANEFRCIPMTYVKSSTQKHQRLRDAYLELAAASAPEGRPWRTKRQTRELISIDMLDPLIRAVHQELILARGDWDIIKQESANEAEARAAGTMRECACCFSDAPPNRMTTCNSANPHYFCFDCTKMHVETIIGSGKCVAKCMDMSSCDAVFVEKQLRVCIDQKTITHLLRLQQQQDLRDANIDGLTECPFCDFMAICPSVQLDREFRCENPECKKISCRLCKHESHVPLSCEEAIKENKLDARHFVEEAMTDALIRTCNKCDTRFVKEAGCNKMTCPKCKNTQCYLCHEDVKGYEHFKVDVDNGKDCWAHDVIGIEVRHQQDVKRAAETAKAKITAERPEISSEDLNMRVPDEIRKVNQVDEYQRLQDHPVRTRHELLQRGFIRQRPRAIPNFQAVHRKDINAELPRHLVEHPPGRTPRNERAKALLERARNSMRETSQNQLQQPFHELQTKLEGADDQTTVVGIEQQQPTSGVAGDHSDGLGDPTSHSGDLWNFQTDLPQLHPFHPLERHYKSYFQTPFTGWNGSAAHTHQNNTTLNDIPEHALPSMGLFHPQLSQNHNNELFEGVLPPLGADDLVWVPGIDPSRVNHPARDHFAPGTIINNDIGPYGSTAAEHMNYRYRKLEPPVAAYPSQTTNNLNRLHTPILYEAQFDPVNMLHDNYPEVNAYTTVALTGQAPTW